MAFEEKDDESHGSPMHLGLTGQFSPEDIQELLGVMGDDHKEGDSESESPHARVGVGNSTCANSTCSSLPHEASTSTTTPSDDALSSDQPTTVHASAADSSFPGTQPGEEAKAQARSERKRSREKQRRCDVNKRFTDLTHLLQKIDSEDVNDEDAKNGTSANNRVTFNPSNRVDLIARTIVLLERLHEANKRRKGEISKLQQQLEEAKKAGEDTAAKLKEAMLAPPGQPMNKQFMMMVPMMMSSDGSGATAAMPMVNPFIPQHAAVPQAFSPMPTQVAPPTVASAPASTHAFMPPASAIAPPAQAASAAPAPTPQPAAHSMMAMQPMGTAAQQHHTQHHPAAYPPFMMPAHMSGSAGSFMMPVPGPGHHHAMVGQPMTMMNHPHYQAAMQSTGQPVPPAQDSQSHQHEEQKDSSQGLNGGSNLAHCA